MLLFNVAVAIAVAPCTGISIHLMLLFNIWQGKPNSGIYRISIHLMLLFNIADKTLLTFIAEFQYI